MIKVSVSDAISEIDAATEDDVAYGDSEILQYCYDHYVVSTYLGGTGEAVIPRHFLEDWEELTKSEKESFVRAALSK